jgi:HEAT repeat protein
MNRWAINRVLTQSDLPYYLLSFLGGFCIYILKLASVVKVLDDLGMSFYPWLMLIQGFSIYAAIKFSETKATEKPFEFCSMIFVAGLIVVGVGNAPGYSDYFQSHFFSIGLFVTSSILLSLIEVNLNDIIFSQISLLKNPRIATSLALFEETGALSGAALTFFGGSLAHSKLTFTTSLIPFVLSAVLLFALKKKEGNKTEAIVKPKPAESISLRIYPFSFMVIGLFTALLCLKHLQGFTVMVGLDQLKGQGGDGLTKIFSQFSMIQTSLIFVVLLTSLWRKNRLPTWSKGIKSFLTIQSVSMGLLLAIPNPFLYLGTGAMRKIWQHTFLEESMNILNSSLPHAIRIKVRSMMERYGNLVAYTLLAGVSYLCINKFVPMWTAWVLTAAIGGIGLIMRKKLFSTLTDYQVGNIVRTDVYEAVNSCYTLANPEASNHAMAMISLMNQKPRPILLKAIIKSLGNMHSEEAIIPLMNIYQVNTREDVQLAAIESLLKFKSHDIDLFLLSSLQKIIEEQTSLGEIRRSIFTAITSRLNDVAIPMLLGILKNNPEDQRIIANVLIVLGEIAVRRDDLALLEKISEYLAPQYTRRVRANALIFLFHHKKFHHKASSIFGTFLASNDEYDRSAVAFLAGELRLRGMMGFVLENSKTQNHHNSTLLMALLKLGYDEASYLCADLILNASAEQRVIALNQLSAINNSNTRYKVYFEVIEKFPDRVNDFLHLLVKSNRDYDEDRCLIHKEAKRLGLDVLEDNQLFLTDQPREVKAA